jgi:hypothetical protein
VPKKNTPSQFNIDAAAESAMKLITSATEAAAKTLANAAAEAVKVVAATAAESAKTIEFRRTEDHDLLITLKEKMEGLKQDILELKVGYASKIDNHELRLKALCEWKYGLEGETGLLANIPRNCSRLTKLETGRTYQNLWMAGIVAILGVLVGLLIFHILKV